MVLTARLMLAATGPHATPHKHVLPMCACTCAYVCAPACVHACIHVCARMCAVSHRDHPCYPKNTHSPAACPTLQPGLSSRIHEAVSPPVGLGADDGSRGRDGHCSEVVPHIHLASQGGEGHTCMYVVGARVGVQVSGGAGEYQGLSQGKGGM